MERRKICRYFERGSCRKQNCPFVHLRENRKNCIFYMEGTCRKGANCNFYHPPKESEKLASLKQQLKAKKNIKPSKKQSSDEQEQIEQHHEVQVKPQHQNEQQNETEEERNIKQDEKHDNLIKQGKQKQDLHQKEVKVQTQANQRNQKIQKINFLLGINEDNESQEQISDSDNEGTNNKVNQIQFVKTWLKKFPDFNKTAQMKAQILKNEEIYFKGEKYLSLIGKITDPTQKQYYQIIRKFTDHFKHEQNEPRHFSIKIRPLLYDKEINLHFEFVEDTLDIDIDATKYPQSRAIFTILNKSIPVQYKEKMIDIINKYHAKATLFDTLKLLQNKFQKVYQECKFRLQNEHYSKKQLERKLKEERNAIKNEQKTQQSVVRKKKVKKQAGNDHPDVKIIKYKQGEKVEHLFYNNEISVESIVLQNCEYVVVQKILVYIECMCEKKIAYLLDAANDRSLVVGIKLECKKCRNVIELGIQREVVQVRKELLGRIGVNHGRLIDVGGVGFKIGCNCNNQISKGRLYLPGQRITSNCHHCFQSMLVSYMGLRSYNPTIKTPQVKIDSQLPGKGICKHAKLSFRWFRYGCCGRCFSCDDCHIMESCVVHEKIKGITMLCGYCSRQQLIGNECSYCHKQLLKGMDKTGHWEGGMGCRDQALLSRKDAKKYTGMTKHKQKDK